MANRRTPPHEGAPSRPSTAALPSKGQGPDEGDSKACHSRNPDPTPTNTTLFISGGNNTVASPATVSPTSCTETQRSAKGWGQGRPNRAGKPRRSPRAPAAPTAPSELAKRFEYTCWLALSESGTPPGVLRAYPCFPLGPYDELYEELGRPSILPEPLLKARVWRVLPNVRSKWLSAEERG